MSTQSASSILIRHARIVNEGQQFDADVLIQNGRIAKIAPSLDTTADIEIDASGQYLLPGMIDDQVHFRDPGMPHKGSMATESRAAVAGGITSFMDMPNTNPPTLNVEALVAKKQHAATVSVANYGFHFGVSNDNIDIVAGLDPNSVSGVKVFMGASTGNMLVDDPQILERLFAEVPTILLTHCEHTPSITANEQRYKAEYGDDIPAYLHPVIRDHEACYRSSSYAVGLAKKYNTRLHVLHLTTAKELDLFEAKPTAEKRITAEVCVHHLWFEESSYQTLGHLIKCNPAIKGMADRQALRQAVVDGRIDVIGTDHAPHTWEEKQNPYSKAPSGLPLVQHTLPALLELVDQGVMPIELMVAKNSHRVADLFQITDRGYIREGYWADLVLVKRHDIAIAVKNQPVLAHCGWTPFVHEAFHYTVETTIVSGQIAWQYGQVQDECRGEALAFSR